MATKDPRVDAYIEAAADFAKPVLAKLRALVHKACPEVQETIKWKMPVFEYKGPLCSMAAFKHHCVFGFWKQAILFGPSAISTYGASGAAVIPAKITGLDDLPSDAAIMALVRQAADLNEAGVRLPPRKQQQPLEAPVDLAHALKQAKGAAQQFKMMSTACQREYIQWIEEAKRDETRRSRIATAVEWIGQGKARNWKYQR